MDEVSQLQMIYPNHLLNDSVYNNELYVYFTTRYWEGVFCDVFISLKEYPNCLPQFSSNVLTPEELSYLNQFSCDICQSDLWLLELFTSIITIISEMLDNHANKFQVDTKVTKKLKKSQQQNVQITKTPKQNTESPYVFHRSVSFTVNKSTFFASVAVVRSLEDVDRFLNYIKSQSDCIDATHNIAGWRLSDGESGSDEDGEKSAGSKLQFVLEMSGYLGVAVVVTRFFGGILLGPVRFKIINECALKAIDDCFQNDLLQGICRVPRKSKK